MLIFFKFSCVYILFSELPMFFFSLLSLFKMFLQFIGSDYFSLLSCLVLISVALAPPLLISQLAVLYGLSSLWFNGILHYSDSALV